MLVISLFIMGLVVIAASLFVYHISSIKNPISFKEGFDLTDLPIIVVYQGHEKFTLLLDTGSTHNTLNRSEASRLKYTDTLRHRCNIGKEGHETKLPIINFDFGYRNIKFNGDFMLDDLTPAFDYIKNCTGVQLHGIVGCEFFAKYKYILDFKSLIFYTK